MSNDKQGQSQNRVVTTAGRTALVTGAAAGLGLAAAAALVEADWRILGVDRKRPTSKARSIYTSFVQGDIRSKRTAERIDSMIRKEGSTLFGLVNAAGSSARIEWDQMSYSSLATSVGDNLLSTIWATQLAWPWFGDGSVIVNVSSVHARVADPKLIPYGAAKAGVEAFTRAIASKGFDRRIRCNCVVPGWVLTPGELTNHPGIVLSELVERGERMPLGRQQTSEDLANSILFLMSDLASQITGQILHIDGGLSIIHSG
jgi:NAD(P)-dependent dehydrogenase (short-subunit alcohol dehydrogenase family)